MCVCLCVATSFVLGPIKGARLNTWSVDSAQLRRESFSHWKEQPRVQTCHSLSLGMVNPQIRLVQAATVPLSSSHLSPPQSHSRPPSSHRWLMGFPASFLVSSLLCIPGQNTFMHFFFKVGVSCFLIKDIPWIILSSQTNQEQMARMASMPPNFPFHVSRMWLF